MTEYQRANEPGSIKQGDAYKRMLLSHWAHYGDAKPLLVNIKPHDKQALLKKLVRTGVRTFLCSRNQDDLGFHHWSTLVKESLREALTRLSKRQSELADYFNRQLASHYTDQHEHSMVLDAPLGVFVDYPSWSDLKDKSLKEVLTLVCTEQPRPRIENFLKRRLKKQNYDEGAYIAVLNAPLDTFVTLEDYPENEDYAFKKNEMLAPVDKRVLEYLRDKWAQLEKTETGLEKRLFLVFGAFCFLLTVREYWRCYRRLGNQLSFYWLIMLFVNDETSQFDAAFESVPEQDRELFHAEFDDFRRDHGRYRGLQYFKGCARQLEEWFRDLHTCFPNNNWELLPFAQPEQAYLEKLWINIDDYVRGPR